MFWTLNPLALRQTLSHKGEAPSIQEVLGVSHFLLESTGALDEIVDLLGWTYICWDLFILKLLEGKVMVFFGVDHFFEKSKVVRKQSRIFHF